MKQLTYYDGRITDADEVRIGLTDRSVFFGDGVYDAMIGENRTIFLAEEHIDRLLGNAKRIDLIPPIDRAALLCLLARMTEGTDALPFFLYIQLSRHGAQRTHTFVPTAPSHLLITLSPSTTPDTERTVALITLPDRRYGFCDIKTVNLFPNVLAAREAEKQGADEAVFCRGETVTECSHSNIAILRNDVLYTHPCDEHILPGIARRHLLLACRRIGLCHCEEPFTRRELSDADAVLVTSTTKLCRMAHSVDGRPIDHTSAVGRALCREMLREYRSAIQCPSKQADDRPTADISPFWQQNYCENTDKLQKRG